MLGIILGVGDTIVIKVDKNFDFTGFNIYDGKGEIMKKKMFYVRWW